MKIINILAAAMLGVFLLVATGCNSFERTAFQSLSASKVVLDAAQTDYEISPLGTGKLPHNACVYAIINDGKAAQTSGVNALQVYDTILTNKQDTAVAAAAVTAQLAVIAADLVKVKAIYSNPNCS